MQQATPLDGSKEVAGRGMPRTLLDLQIDGLTLNEAPILGKIALQVDPEETVALTGPSGIGKTTLLRVIAGLQEGYEGVVRRNGSVGFVFQEPTLLPWRSALQNICIATEVSETVAKDLMNEVGLSGQEKHFPAQMSLGQQRRLSLARSLAAEPDLLLLDEPFVSLDPAMVEDMMALFIRIRDRHKMASIIVTHVEAEAKALSDRIVKLGGSPATIVGSAD